MKCWEKFFGQKSCKTKTLPTPVQAETSRSDANRTHESSAHISTDPNRVAIANDGSFIKRKHRNIRVFVSSTFEDMQEERDILVKNIFPQLRKMCLERGVGFTEVDLRWGVTQEQAERGEVLPICLAEIENSRPYFIGLLGERYGWIPEVVPDDMTEAHPWLSEHRQRSITELEIVHGVLRNPDMAHHAFFYFRDSSAPSSISSQPRTYS